MDINVSDTSFAFSDIVGPSHVSGLESFSDFDASDYSESFEDQEARDSGVEEESVTPNNLESSQNENKDARPDSFSFGLHNLPTGDIKDFLNALECAKAQLGMAIESQEKDSPVQDESSLGILNLDSIQEMSGFCSGRSSSELLISQENYKSKKVDDKENQGDSEGELPFAGEYSAPLALSDLSEDKTLKDKSDIAEQPHSFFNVPADQDADVTNEPGDISSLPTMSQSKDDFQFMLQTTRSGSGDGGELIDRVSLTSSISFLQSQTFPDSVFSQSLSSYSRGSGSGTDSGSGSDNDTNNQRGDIDDEREEMSPDLIHDAGDGSNGQSSTSVGRPGLEGANSEPEDNYAISGPSSDVGGSIAESIELRQSGEGDDVMPDLPGDGGGGGDGSSGHSSDDDQDIGSGPPSSARSTPTSSISGNSDHYVAMVTPQIPNSSLGALDVSSNRGPPVGHASVDGSPPLIPSPPTRPGQYANTSLDQFDVLASSTPMVRAGKNAFTFDTPANEDSSAIGSQYLLATHPTRQGNGVTAMQQPLMPPQDGSFHLSQILESSRNKEDHENTLTEAASIDFEAQGLTPRPPFRTISDNEQDKTLTARTPARVHGNFGASNLSEGDSDILNLGTSINSSIGFQGSFLGGGISAVDNSLFWKSTPRDELEETTRATPGILFEGNSRPSPVPQDQNDMQNNAAGGTAEKGIRKKGQLTTQLGASIVHQARLPHEDPLAKRLQTPGGSGEQTIPFSSWSQDASYSSSIMAGVYNPFENEVVDNADWKEDQNIDFTAAGDPEALLAADEKSFEKEHQFDVPVNISPADVTNNHDWTIPNESCNMARSSLTKIVAVNDPDDKGEVRISLGAFIAAGSEELGSLQSSDPSRPRPHFGDSHSITTPSPQPPPRLISNVFAERQNFEDPPKIDEYSFQTTPNKQTNTPDPKHRELKTVKKAPKSYNSRQGETHQEDESVFDLKKVNLNTQHDESRHESAKERRGSQGSVHSSHSSSSKSSVQSVVRKKEKSKKQRIGSQESAGDSKQQHRHRRQREPDGCPDKENTGPLVKSLPSSSKNTSTTKDILQNQDAPLSKSKHSLTSKRHRTTTARKVVDGQDRAEKSKGSASLEPQSHGSTSSQHRQNVSRPNQKPKDQAASSTSDISKIDAKNTGSSLSSILTSGSFGSLSQHELAEFIAKAINIPHEHIEQLLNAASEAKSRGVYSRDKETLQVSPVKETSVSKCDQSVSSKEIESVNKSPEIEKLKSIKPIASSSPHDVVTSSASVTSLSMASQGLASPANVQCTSSFDSTRSPPQDMISSYSIDSSVFVQDSPENVSVIENSTIVSPTKDVPLSPPPDPFSNNHIEPFFGKTYTVKDQNGPSGHVVDPLKNRANMIEKRLDESLSPDKQVTRRSSADFQPVASMTSCSVVSEDMTLMESPEKYTLKKLQRSFDNTAYAKSPYSESKSRHSWPKTDVDSTYQQAEVVRGGHPVGLSSNLPMASMTSKPASYMRPVTIGVPPHVQPQTLAGISPVTIQTSQFPGQTGTFGYPAPQAFGPQPGGYIQNMNGPLSGTLPMHYTAFPQNSGPNSLNTLIGQVSNQAVQRQFPSTIYPPDGFSAPGYLGPGAISVGHQNHQVTPYSLYSDTQQPLHLNTVSAATAPRLATITQTFPWQVQGSFPLAAEQGQQHLQTAPPGLLQLGQPMASQGRTLSTDSQPSGAQNARTASSLTPIMIPGEVKLPPVCPVGIETRSLLTLHNSSSRWIYCMVKVAYCTVNGAQVTNSVDNPFFVPSRLIINPHTTIPIEVIFKPRLAGLHTAQLHVTSSPVASDGQQTTETLPSLVALEAVAEQPDIEILSEDSQVVDFGEMATNSKHSRPLRLINKGKAAIPIRLTITPNATSLHCFSFVNADTSPKKSLSSTPPSKNATNKGILSIHKVLLSGTQAVNGSIDPHVIWILFQAPQKTDPGPGSLGLPDEFTARVDIEMDCDEGPIIGSVLLKSTVGVARLHTPKSLQALTLSGVVGQRISRAFPLRNAGNISLQVDLKICQNMEYFTVTPSRTVLRPQQEVEVAVQFKPSKPDAVIDSTLVMSVLPDGPEYDLLLRGMATSEKKAPSKQDSTILLCNKPVVCWSGVAIGKAVQQKVVLKHNGLMSSKKLKLQLSIQGQHPDFQLQNTFGKVDEKSLASIVSLAPQEELPVHILFAPSTLGLISSALVIRTLSGGTKSKVPLYGCGGSSELVIADTRKLSEGYVANIGEVSLGKKNVVKLTVKNIGTRPAFVKAVCYSDVPSLTLYPATHLNIAPNNFVLPERTSKQVVVVYQPLENDAIKCKTEISTVATVAFYTGDEGIRQQYKRYVQRNDLPHTAAKCTGPLMNINFLTAFQDEDKVIEDMVYPQVPQWTQFFQSCVSRVLLMLVGSPPSSPEKAEANRSLDLVPMQGPSENGPPALAKETVKTVPAPKPEVVDAKNPDAWTVLPEHLVLTAYETLGEKGTGRLQIINFSERPLTFEFIWPAHCLTITPDRGQIPSRSQVMVVMSSRPTLASSGIDLPWGGTVYIQCDGTQKAVCVQIREEVILENTPYKPGAVTLHALETKEGGATPFTPALPTSHLPPLVVRTKPVEFEETVAGKESVTELVIENIGQANVMWDLSSVAPAYVKASDDTGDIYRTTYTAFSFHKQSGVAASMAVIKLPIKFQPRDPGRYSQFWELQFKQDGLRRVHKEKIEITAKAIKPRVTRKEDQPNLSKLSREPHQAHPNTNQQPSNTGTKPEEMSIKPASSNQQDSAPKPQSRPSSIRRSGKPKGVYITESEVHFPDTTVGESSEVKVKVCNDSDQPSLVKVVGPKEPFSVSNVKVTVKPHRFVRLPIKFAPETPGTSYESVMVFTATSGNIQQIKVMGNSTDLM